EHAHGGGLSRAVGTEHAEHGAAWHREVDPAQCVHCAERLLELLDDDRVLAVRRHAACFNRFRRSLKTARSSSRSPSLVTLSPSARNRTLTSVPSACAARTSG